MAGCSSKLTRYQRSVSPSKFESQANSSPSKLSVPNRRSRNQPTNRVHDIEFAAEISTSLLSQVRNLQSLLAEKEEGLKEVTREKLRLEAEAEGFNQRLRSLDESENRYKDENWNLETQIHEHIASAKEAADREQKLTKSLKTLQEEKSAAQKELDEMKLSHARLAEDHTAALKHHDVELGGAKRNIMMMETERGALQRKVDELAGQNKELANAVSHQRGRLDEQDQARRLSDEDFDTANDNITPEQSPPASPIKGTPRHSMLESETLKSSLHHAHRMIQNLKGNIHREKTEKLELKRMLQDTRDELEIRRSETNLGGSAVKRRKAESLQFKKPLKPGQLGGVRNSRSEVFIEDAGWEDHIGDGSPTRPSTGTSGGTVRGSANISAPRIDDQFDTSNETSDAFETANERATETEDFQTGAEDLSGNEDLTETESGLPGRAVQSKRPSDLTLSQVYRKSFESTASTSGDEDFYGDVRTPVQSQRLRLKMNRGAFRRSRVGSEVVNANGSPISLLSSSREGTPKGPAQSLFAELEDLDGGSQDDESIYGTPSRQTRSSSVAARSITESIVTPPIASLPAPQIPKAIMVDSGMMTETWESTPPTPQTAVPHFARSGFVGEGLADRTVSGGDLWKHSQRPSEEPAVVRFSTMTDASSQWQEDAAYLKVVDEVRGAPRPMSTSTYSDVSSQHDADMGEKLAEFPSPPISPKHAPMASISDLMTLSSIRFEHVEPVAEPEPRPATPEVIIEKESLAFSSIRSEHVEPILEQDLGSSTPMAFSAIISEHVEPLVVEDLGSLTPVMAPMTLSSIVSEHVEPIADRDIRPSTPQARIQTNPLAYSSIQSMGTEPVEEELILRSPKRDGIFIPRHEPSNNLQEVQHEDAATPRHGILDTVFGWGKTKTPATPIIAEDDTRQSPSQSPLADTPESQRPFREVVNESNTRATRKIKFDMADEGSQTALTSEQIDAMLNKKTNAQAAIGGNNEQQINTTPTGDRALGAATAGGAMTFAAIRARKSQESIGSLNRGPSRTADSDLTHDPLLTKRPGSAASRRGSTTSSHPPLPPDHKKVIAAASVRGEPRAESRAESRNEPRAESSNVSQGAAGSMGPPLVPASAYKANPTFRPKTPSSPQMGVPSIRGGTTPRGLGTADVSQSTFHRSNRSRASSVTSFASEVDHRFNPLGGGMPMPHGVAPGTDPRMIQAITQTMIGEYLWKYTRKAGRGEMSDNRHRRYFWVHPYTRTLYWSDRDPTQAGRAQLKAKSVAIEAVRVVTDDNPMPPGLHRKSLIILTPGRAVKFTATTGQRHETWFNALSYLLIRTNNEATALGDTEEVATGALTRDDVDEFNPSYSNRSVRRGPASLSSYNSRTTRNASPVPGQVSASSLHPPHLTKSGSKSSQGTFSRLSGNFLNRNNDSQGGVFGSRRGRLSVGGNANGAGSIYQASEVHDSAEDVREMIEQQDREADKLENVRACCDGKSLLIYSEHRDRLRQR